VFYPGEIEFLKERERRQQGIDVEDSTWQKLQSLARGYGLAEELGLT
jgi:uncharacterized oxidoreductase